MVKRLITTILIAVCLLLLIFSQPTFADTVFFYHTDPAGTPLAMSDATGNVVWRADYKPFGEEWSVMQNQENNKMFVGKEKDTETGLLYFGARYMTSNLGRFISTDPVGPVNPATGKINQVILANPQRLNFYSYGLNNPYRYMDSNGYWSEDVHNAMIKATFSEGKYELSEKAVAGLMKGSAKVDSMQFQGLEYTYMHAMSSSPDQSVDAKKQMINFMEGKLIEYKNLMAQGKTFEAYTALGMAMHPLMDSTSPAHEGFQVWEDTVIDAIKHGKKEKDKIFYSSPDYLGKAVKILREFYDANIQ